ATPAPPSRSWRSKRASESEKTGSGSEVTAEAESLPQSLPPGLTDGVTSEPEVPERTEVRRVDQRPGPESVTPLSLRKRNRTDARSGARARRATPSSPRSFASRLNRVSPRRECASARACAPDTPIPTFVSQRIRSCPKEPERVRKRTPSGPRLL